jgi:hypothetical protein
MDIQYDIAKLIRTRTFLSRLQDRQETLLDDLGKVMVASEMAKKYNHEIEECHARAIEAAFEIV